MTAQLLTLLLPYVPHVLEFLAEQLGRMLLHQSSHIQEKTDEQKVLDTVTLIVRQVDDAHPGWSNEDKRVAAAGGIRHHLQRVHGITLAEREVNLLIELAVLRLRATGRAALAT